MNRFETSSPPDTQQLAAAFASVCRPGDVVLLVGDLGAGKTTFVKGFAVGLGLVDPVTSPTFTLVQQYENATTRLLHADVYRLADPDISDLVLAELIDGDAISIVEWGERAASAIGRSYCEVVLEADDLAHAAEEDSYGVVAEPRRVAFRYVGADWVERADLVHKTLQQWLVGGAS
jgi:tRNA threonylcarbamoyladenosine biosynthesis protein TsaE